MPLYTFPPSLLFVVSTIQVMTDRRTGTVIYIVTGFRYADCHCYPTAGYNVTAAGVTEFPEICAVATQRKGGYEFHIRSNDQLFLE
jgi:hypothetical protein